MTTKRVKEWAERNSPHMESREERASLVTDSTAVNLGASELASNQGKLV